MRLLDLLEAETPNRPVVVYGGRFQPFHLGHAAVYKSLCDHFGADNVWVTSSNKVTERTDDKFSPLTFDERCLFMKKLGVREDRIQQCKNPAFAPVEVFSKFKEPLAYVAVGGEKDAERYNANKFFLPYPTENGRPLKFDSVKGKLEPLSARRGYFLLASPQAGGLSGTQIRQELMTGDESKRKAAFKKHIGEFDENLYKLLQGKLNVGIVSSDERD